MSNIHSLPCTKRTRFTPAQIHALEELLDNTIDHKCLLDEAFETPRSNPAFSSNPDGHKGLAQLGDAILRLAIWLYASERGYSTSKPLPLFGSFLVTHANIGYSKRAFKFT
jgi:hypothetical protein